MNRKRSRIRRKLRRNVCVVTGTRAEYGLLRSVMEAIAAHSGLNLQLCVTGTHLLRRFGRTIDEIRADGWRIDATVPMQRGDDDPLDQARGLASGVAGIAHYIEKAGTDIVLVLGDRIEAMAGALAGVTTGRVVGHIHGGEAAPGDFDESLRHAITKLAHVHFPATRTAATRVIRTGEDPARVHMVGAPGLDHIRRMQRATRQPSAGQPQTALVVQHPCGRSADVEEHVMHLILGETRDAGLRRVIIEPNSDRGHMGIRRAIQRCVHAERNGSVVVHRSLPRDQYLRLLVESAVLIGNSSSGILEAGFCGTPVVNVGDRQQGRQRCSDWIFDARETRASLRAVLRRALKHRPIASRTRAFGDGRAGERIADVLSEVPISEAFRRKGAESPSRRRPA